ncbi:hypothetical protein ACFFX0_27385 [Citricoccus parietis]|uniref:Secreted protein n=1 Tax=Citricoccus parietis TaxID=592307 RepID=A0ABV5G6Y7_9MICC
MARADRCGHRSGWAAAWAMSCSCVESACSSHVTVMPLGIAGGTGHSLDQYGGHRHQSCAVPTRGSGPRVTRLGPGRDVHGAFPETTAAPLV